MNIESRIHVEIRKNAKKICYKYPHIDSDDAVIMSSTTMLVELFDDFIESVLQIRYAEGEMYNVEATIHDFIQSRNQLMILMVDIGLGVARKYPNVARIFFADRVDTFKEQIKGIEMTGIVKAIYDIQADFHLFERLVSGGIISHQLEQGLKSFEGLAPDTKKLYMLGLSNLGSKARTGRYVFDAMVGIGRGVPLTAGEIATETGKARKTVKKGIDEIMDNAGHMIRVVQRGQVDTYYIPEEFRRLHFG